MSEVSNDAVETPRRMVRLEASDGGVEELPVEAAALSGLVRSMLDPDVPDDDEDDEEASLVPLPNVEGAALAEIARFCTHHVEEPLDPIEKPLPDPDIRRCTTQEWYAAFVEELWQDDQLFFAVMLAANYMEVVPLQDLVCGYFAGRLKLMKPEEIEGQYAMTMSDLERRQILQEYEATKRHER